jgi:hypothetical protein
MRIDAKMLIAKNACAEQVAIFEQEWPEGVHVTREVCDRARELGLDLTWLARKFLTATARSTYEQTEITALATYERVEIMPLATYERAMAAAQEAYEQAEAEPQARVTAREAYRRRKDTALAAYDQAMATALAVYEQAKATALWTAICEMEENTSA